MTEDKTPEIKDSETPPVDDLSITHHSIEMNGERLNYTVTTGTIVLKEEGKKKGKATGMKPKATLFFMAYTLDAVENPSTRPLTFAFNGGPGSSSVWLHLGVLGPRRVWLEEDGQAPPPPYHLVDNEFSILDISDLVFIDPVSTGYSRTVPGEKLEEFHNFKKDIESVGDFIRLYTTRYRRWTSPKFLIGESYGTTRAAGLAGYLQEEHGFYLNGLMLVSIVLNFQTILFGTGNDLPHILFLPTFAAAAWYHRRLPEALQSYSLEQLLAEVAAFAMGDYALALMQGSTLAAEEKQRITRQLAAYTGLSENYVGRTNLRINIHRFTKELLRDQRRTIGRFDSRYSGIDRDAAGEFYESDPSDREINGAFTATLQDYLSSELEYESDIPYRVLAHLWQNWRYEEHQNQYVDVAETLRKAMNINPHLKVFVANGYYDLATPYLAAEYTINHLQLEPKLYDNVVMAYYEAGHMMYLHRPSLVKLKQDLADFLRSAVSPQ